MSQFERFFFITFFFEILMMFFFGATVAKTFFRLAMHISAYLTICLAVSTATVINTVPVSTIDAFDDWLHEQYQHKSEGNIQAYAKGWADMIGRLSKLRLVHGTIQLAYGNVDTNGEIHDLVEPGKILENRLWDYYHWVLSHDWPHLSRGYMAYVSLHCQSGHSMFHVRVEDYQTFAPIEYEFYLDRDISCTPLPKDTLNAWSFCRSLCNRVDCHSFLEHRQACVDYDCHA